MFEKLFYQSEFNTAKLQQVRFEAIESDKRPFVLSTPLFESQKSLTINLPFNHTFYDQLFKARDYAISKEDIKALYTYLENPKFSLQEFKSLFTPYNPYINRYNTQATSGIKIKHFGHATVLIESENANILIDPVVSYYYKGQSQRYTLVDLPARIDYVLITHSHLDHLLFETLLQLRYKIRHIVVPKSNEGTLQDPSLKAILREIGFTSIIQTSAMEELFFDNGKIIALPFLGEHGDLDIASKQAYCINIANKNILLAADSNNIQPEMYQHIYRLIGHVDYLFIGMECEGAPMTWLYGSLPLPKLSHTMDRSRRLDGSDCEKAYQIIQILKCKEVFIYAMGGEPWLRFISSIEYEETSKAIVESNKLIEQCKKQGINVERLQGYKYIELS